MSGISSLVVDCPKRNISFQQRETIQMYTKENSTEWKQPLTPHSHGVQLELAQDPHIVKCMQGIHVRLLNPCSEGWQGRGEVTTSCPQQANHQACFSNTHLTRADVASTYLMAESTQSGPWTSWRLCAPARSRMKRTTTTTNAHTNNM